MLVNTLKQIRVCVCGNFIIKFQLLPACISYVIDKRCNKNYSERERKGEIAAVSRRLETKEIDFYSIYLIL